MVLILFDHFDTVTAAPFDYDLHYFAAVSAMYDFGVVSYFSDLDAIVV